MPAIGMTSSSYGLTITVDAAGLPTGVSDVKAGIVDGLIAETTGLLNGGKTTAIGAAHTIAEVAKFWGGATIRNMQNGDRVRLNPWSNA